MLVAAVLIVMANLIVDILYSFIDPRVRRRMSGDTPHDRPDVHRRRQAADRTDDPFLVVENLTVQFPTHDGLVQAVTDLSYTVERGKTLGIVGESGSGKCVSSMAVLGLHDPKRTRLRGSIRVDGQEVIGADEDRMRKLRGNDVAMIFQDALTALHPFYSIGDQISEGYRIHHKVSKSRAPKRAIEMLDRVGIPQANRRVDDYPAPVLRRHAAARDDRDGAGQRPAAADRRRADHRARRDRAGADPRPAAGPAARVQLRGHHHHPRPRRHRRDGRRRRW